MRVEPLFLSRAAKNSIFCVCLLSSLLSKVLLSVCGFSLGVFASATRALVASVRITASRHKGSNKVSPAVISPAVVSLALALLLRVIAIIGFTFSL